MSEPSTRAPAGPDAERPGHTARANRCVVVGLGAKA
jgi:hypothetical protein